MSKHNQENWTEELHETSLIGKQYAEQLGGELSNTDEEKKFDFAEINARYQELVLNSVLTEFQKCAVLSLFKAFNYIQAHINPDRLKEFKWSMNNDGELLIYRSCKHGLANIIIHDDECIAFSYIPFNPDEKKELLFFEDAKEDMEKIAYLLFKH